MFEKIKLALRIDVDELDGEIKDTIEAAISDLKLCGVSKSKIVETDPLILRAVKTFCRAEFSSDEKEAARLKESYEMIRNHLCLSIEYTQTQDVIKL
ncbi:DNA-packaging protein [Clostridium botulinum]|nr:DNA-packaging protein [Clostridium botulinum]EKO2043672.1 DNA-packaging protein [Clostridium botulinum]